MSNNATITRTKRPAITADAIVRALRGFTYTTNIGSPRMFTSGQLTNIAQRLLAINGEITRTDVGMRIASEIFNFSMTGYDQNRAADNFLRRLKTAGIATFNRDTKTWTLA